MGTSAQVPARVLTRIRTVCLALPEVHEEAAWVGTRWRVRGRTFAHVLAIAEGWPPAYAKALGADGPSTVLMFRSAGEELELLRAAAHPYFAPPWRADEVGLVLSGRVDWPHVAELLTDSYRAQAPKKLAARLDLRLHATGSSDI